VLIKSKPASKIQLTRKMMLARSEASDTVLLISGKAC
jgi:hypothetical protein